MQISICNGVLLIQVLNALITIKSCFARQSVRQRERTQQSEESSSKSTHNSWSRGCKKERKKASLK